MVVGRIKFRKRPGFTAFGPVAGRTVVAPADREVLAWPASITASASIARGGTAIAEIEPNVRCMVMFASDPYAVAGVISPFRKRPDLVPGAAANTEARIALVEKLCDIKALDCWTSVR